MLLLRYSYDTLSMAMHCMHTLLRLVHVARTPPIDEGGACASGVWLQAWTCGYQRDLNTRENDKFLFVPLAIWTTVVC